MIGRSQRSKPEDVLWSFLTSGAISGLGVPIYFVNTTQVRYKCVTHHFVPAFGVVPCEAALLSGSTVGGILSADTLLGRLIALRVTGNFMLGLYATSPVSG